MSGPTTSPDYPTKVTLTSVLAKSIVLMSCSFYLISPQHWTISTTHFRKPFLPMRSASPNLCPPHLRGSLLLLPLPHTSVLLEVLSAHSSILLGGGPIYSNGFSITFLLRPDTLSPDHLLPTAVSPSTLSSKPGTWLILCSPLSFSSPLFQSQSALSIDFSLFIFLILLSPWPHLT